MANFKIGDKVRILPHKNGHSDTNRVFKIVKDQDALGRYVAEALDKKDAFLVHDDDLVLANSRAHNSRLNIRVGSQIYDPKNGEIYRVQKINGDTIIAKSNLNGEVKSFKNDDEAVGIFSNSRRISTTNPVVANAMEKVRNGGWVGGPSLPSVRTIADYPKDAKSPRGVEFQKWLSTIDGKDVPSDWRALLTKKGYVVPNAKVTSTNPVVRKAMNAVARNALFKVGDRVLLKHGGADWGTIKLVAGKMHGVQQYRVTWDHNGEDVVFEDDLVTSQKDVR